MEKDMEIKITEVELEEMEKVSGGRTKLNGPFCLACGTALTYANGSYKCMKAGCTMEGDPQVGYYMKNPGTGVRG